VKHPLSDIYVNKTDHELIHAVLAGNMIAFQTLVSKYKNMVFSLVYNILLNKEDTEEITQDSFIKAYKGLPGFKRESSFSTWLYRIAVNTALNKKKIQSFSITPIDDLNEIEDYNNLYTSLEQYENSDRKKYVQEALKQLKDDERICVTMFYLNELQVNEIHELTGFSVANIKVLLHRGRKNLYTQLERLLQSEINNLI
jgi:RNA polymerase sigma factor (sigma-70 family)